MVSRPPANGRSVIRSPLMHSESFYRRGARTIALSAGKYSRTKMKLRRISLLFYTLRPVKLTYENLHKQLLCAASLSMAGPLRQLVLVSKEDRP